MSRIGKKTIAIPKGVQITIEGNLIKIKGPKTELKKQLPEEIFIKIENEKIFVKLKEKIAYEKRPLHGLYRSLIANMILGVTKEFEKRLSLVGVGFRAAMKGKDIELRIGYSNPIIFKIPENISVTVEKATQIIIRGEDKQQVGQVAAGIRNLRTPEPYKGKGIRYEGEYVRKKPGKTAVKGAQ